MKKIIYTIAIIIMCLSCSSNDKKVNRQIQTLQQLKIDDTQIIKNNKIKPKEHNELEELINYVDSNNMFSKREKLDRSIASLKVNNINIKLLYCINNPIKMEKLLKTIDKLNTQNVIGLVVYNHNQGFICNNTYYQYDVLYLNDQMQVISKGVENSKTHCSTKLSNIAFYIPKGIIPINKIQVNDTINIPNVYDMSIYKFKGE